MTRREFEARSAELEEEIKGYEEEMDDLCNYCPRGHGSDDPGYYDDYCETCGAFEELELSKERAMTDLYLLEAEYERG